MKYEKFDRKVPFETFLENMNNYAITNLKDIKYPNVAIESH